MGVKKLDSVNHQLELNDRLAQIIELKVKEVFQTMLGIKVDSEPYAILTNFVGQGDVTGIVNMTQEKMEGSLIVSFPKNCIFSFLENIYGKSFDEINKTVKECVGEITNVVYASAKKSLNEEGHSFKMAIPNVVVGQEHMIYNMDLSKAMVMTFSSGEHSFEVIVTLQG